MDGPKQTGISRVNLNTRMGTGRNWQGTRYTAGKDDTEAQKKDQHATRQVRKQTAGRVGEGGAALALLFLSSLCLPQVPDKRHLPPCVSCPQDFPLVIVTIGSSVFYLNKLTPANESVSYCVILPREQMSLTSLNNHIQKAPSGMSLNSGISGPMAKTDLESVLTLTPRLGLFPPGIPWSFLTSLDFPFLCISKQMGGGGQVAGSNTCTPTWMRGTP